MYGDEEDEDDTTGITGELVPLEVKVIDGARIHVRAKEPDYARPGSEEVQAFD